MNLLNASHVQDVVEQLRSIANSCEWLHENSGEGHDAAYTKDVRSTMKGAAVVCAAHEFTDAMRIADRAYHQLEVVRDYAFIQSEATHVADAICDELKKRTFVTVNATRAAYVESLDWMGEEVSAAFLEAQADIYDAGNCLGVECGTAAVFHMMRVVEWGLRYLCSHLGLRKMRTRRGKTIPITYVDWETMLNGLNPRVDAKIEKMKRGSQKQAAQEFYYPVLQDIRAIRDAWRNHLMHTRAVYTTEDAEAIAGHIKRIMSALAKFKDKRDDKAKK